MIVKRPPLKGISLVGSQLKNSSERPFADLTGLKAFVTGASSGIGRAIALEFARAGADVLVHYARSATAAEALAREIEALGRQASLFRHDFLQGRFEEFADIVWKRSGQIDVWVNNAGVDLLTGPEAKWEFAEKLKLLWEIDVAGTVILTRAAMQRMKLAGRGVILNIGWDQADRGMAGESAELFSAAKNAIMGFTRSAAMTAAPEVRVNCIAPGWIQTAWGETASEEWQSRVMSETPLRRWGLPEDIARLARFLVSLDASYITGQVVNANGGAVR